jgi:hypothetical protein
MGLAGKEQGKNRGIAGGVGEPAKARRLRLYRRRPKAPPRSRATPGSSKSSPQRRAVIFKPTECANLPQDLRVKLIADRSSEARSPSLEIDSERKTKLFAAFREPTLYGLFGDFLI